MTLITSPANPRISKLKDLHTTRGRKKSGLFLMEGPNLLEALFDMHLFPHEIYYQPDYLQRTTKGKALLQRILHTPEIGAEQRVEVSERVIEAISDTVTSQGVVSVLPLEAFRRREGTCTAYSQPRRQRCSVQHCSFLMILLILAIWELSYVLRLLPM